MRLAKDSASDWSIGPSAPAVVRIPHDGRRGRALFGKCRTGDERSRRLPGHQRHQRRPGTGGGVADRGAGARHQHERHRPPAHRPGSGIAVAHGRSRRAGAPGLSVDVRPRRGRSAWYGQWLSEALEQSVPCEILAMGHSLGEAIVLASASARIVGRVLLSNAGLSACRIAKVPPRLRGRRPPCHDRRRREARRPALRGVGVGVGDCFSSRAEPPQSPTPPTPRCRLPR